MRRALPYALMLALLAPGCFMDRSPIDDGLDAGPDASADDGGRDGGGDGGLTLDAGRDSGARDGGPSDGSLDGGLDAQVPLEDGGMDAGGMDGGPLDAGTLDAGPPDAGPPDAGPPDAGMTIDAGCMTGPASCDGADRIVCEPDGTVTRTRCPLGCAAGACLRLLPSNVGGRVAMNAGERALTVPADERIRFDTDSGEVWVSGGFAGTFLRTGLDGTGTRNGIHYARLDPASPGGAQLGVFVIGSFDLPATARVEVRGDRALVLLVTNDATLAGTIDVSSNDESGGPGGSDGGDPNGNGRGAGGGGRGTEPAGNDDTGGAGGSFGTAGAAGNRGAAGPGSTYGTPELAPLVGGSGGGGGGDGDGGRGGGGGGAFQISVGGRLTVSGIIDASGGGGQGGDGGFSDSGAGGGGGSGGAILLEGTLVTVTGILAANGGAGGQGATCGSGAGCFGRASSGGDGGTAVPATGPGASGTGGAGGNGSNADGVAGPGGDAENGGGGGGGAGRIRVNAGVADTTAATFFPSLASGASTLGRPPTTP